MARGFSFLDVLAAISVLAIVSGATAPSMVSAIDQARAAGAARYIAARLNASRLEAVKRSTFVAIRFRPHDGRYVFGAVVDGNGNGVRAADVARGVDVAEPWESALEQHFSGVRFGRHPDAAALSQDDDLGQEAVRIGRSEFLSFSPIGSSTSGTLYIRGHGRQQFAVRVLGSTGRVSVVRYDFQRQQWTD